jgi:hypothetical protein
MRTTIKKIIATVLSFMMVFQMIPAIAAEGETSNEIWADSDLLKQLEIISTTSTVLKGKTIQLDVPEGYEDVQWSSDAENVATVDQEGKVTGVAAGTAKITAQASGKKTSIYIDVVDPYKDNGSYSEKDMTILATGSKKTVTYDGLAYQITYTFSSDREDFDPSKVEILKELPSRSEPGATVENLTPKDFKYNDSNYNVTFRVQNGYIRINGSKVDPEYITVRYRVPSKYTYNGQEITLSPDEQGTVKVADADKDNNLAYNSCQPKQITQHSLENKDYKNGVLTFYYKPQEVGYNLTLYEVDSKEPDANGNWHWTNEMENNRNSTFGQTDRWIDKKDGHSIYYGQSINIDIPTFEGLEYVGNDHGTNVYPATGNDNRYVLYYYRDTKVKSTLYNLAVIKQNGKDTWYRLGRTEILTDKTLSDYIKTIPSGQTQVAIDSKEYELKEYDFKNLVVKPINDNNREYYFQGNLKDEELDPTKNYYKVEYEKGKLEFLVVKDKFSGSKNYIDEVYTDPKYDKNNHATNN